MGMRRGKKGKTGEKRAKQVASSMREPKSKANAAAIHPKQKGSSILEARSTAPTGPSQTRAHAQEQVSTLLNTMPELKYRVKMLLYDLRNIGAKDEGSRLESVRRLESTTHELYISAPYFNDEECRRVLGAVVDCCFRSGSGEDAGGTTEDGVAAPDHDELPEDGHVAEAQVSGAQQVEEAQEAEVEETHTARAMTVEDAIRERLAGFLKKRKASHDARPCGPHDLLPVFCEVFGVLREELGEEGFLRRVRRCGL